MAARGRIVTTTASPTVTTSARTSRAWSRTRAARTGTPTATACRSARTRARPTPARRRATVAKVLTLHPEVTKVRVEGHTDNIGGHAYNMKLSQARAEAVRNHLISVNGVDGGKLTSQGFAFDRPIGDNKTAKGRAKNRRV